MASVIALIEILSMAVVNYRFQLDSEQQVKAELEGAHARVEVFQSISLEKLVTLASFIAEDPRLRGSIVTRDRTTIGRALDELYSNYWHDLFWLLTPDGKVIARVESPDMWGDTLADRSVIFDASNGFDSGDIWIENDRLYHVAAVPIRSGGISVGILLIGEEFNSHFTPQFTQLAGLNLAFLTGDSLISVSESGDRRTRLGSRLAAEQRLGKLSFEQVPVIPKRPTLATEATAPIIRFQLDDEPIGGALFTLSDVTGRELAQGLIYRSLLPEQRQLKRIQLGLLIVDIIAIFLTFVAAWFVSRRITRPIERLVGASARLGKGDLESPIKPEGSDEIGVLASELEDMRSSLVKARADLIQSERLTTIGRMASSIIHDFKQPISAIYGYIDLLTLPGSKPDQIEKYKKSVFNQFDHMLGMINELLEFARGEVRLNKVKINSKRYIEHIIGNFEHQARTKNIELLFDADWSGDFSIDQSKVQRGLENILRNAMQAVGKGGRIAVSLTQANGMAQIKISDNGPGIPPEIREKLFEPFVTFGKSEGTGLGLAVAKRVIVQHGGTIDVESPEGSGASFIIRLPQLPVVVEHTMENS